MWMDEMGQMLDLDVDSIAQEGKKRFEDMPIDLEGMMKRVTADCLLCIR